MGWASGSAILASLCIAFLCWFCFGAVGYAIIQSIATKEMKKYGLNPKYGGFKKPAIKAKVDELRAAEATYAGTTGFAGPSSTPPGLA